MSKLILFKRTNKSLPTVSHSLLSFALGHLTLAFSSRFLSLTGILTQLSTTVLLIFLTVFYMSLDFIRLTSPEVLISVATLPFLCQTLAHTSFLDELQGL